MLKIIFGDVEEARMRVHLLDGLMDVAEREKDK